MEQRHGTKRAQRPRTNQAKPPDAPRTKRRRPQSAPRKRASAKRQQGIQMSVIVGFAAVILLVVGSVMFVRSCENGATASSSAAGRSATAEGASGSTTAHTVSTAKPASVEVMMIGDLLMHDEPVQSGLQSDGSYDFDFLFDNIRDYIEAADVRILNQETVMGDPANGYSLTMGDIGPILNTPTGLADSEARSGFNVILKATNHSLDQGYDGLAHELDYWKANYPTMAVIGANNPHATAGDDSRNYVDNVYVTEVNGIKIGFLNYTYATNITVGSDDASYVSYLDKEKIRTDVQKARDAGAEFLIACPHWGIEYDSTPSDEETTYSKLFCELGVDVIFGCHPHILQPIELLQNDEGHKCVCFYSNGNFIAAGGMQTKALIGGISRVTLQRNEDGTCEVSAASLVPTVICYTYGPNMSAFPIAKWTDDLAAQSERSDLTVDYAHEFCTNLYDEQYDSSKGVVTLDLTEKPKSV